MTRRERSDPRSEPSTPSSTRGRRRPTWALAALAMLPSACGRERPSPATARAEAPSRPVVTVVVERSGGAGTTAVSATVQARQRSALAARVPASVVELPWREGERVAAGAVVARLDDLALRSTLVAAETEGKAADADLARMESLLAKGAATPREVEESRARAATTAAALAAARENLQYALLRAPFEGTVASRPARVGDVVSPGTVLIEIEGAGGLELRASLGPELVSSVRPGLSLDTLVDGQPGPLPAKLSAVSGSGDPATHRFEVRADLPQAPGLRSGLFARLLVPSPQGSARLLVPRSAVFARGGLNGVYVVSEGRAHLRWVALGSTTGPLSELRAGVEAGERVALLPTSLEDGQAVTEAAAERP